MSELVCRRRNLSWFIGMLKLQAGCSCWESLSLGLVGWD